MLSGCLIGAGIGLAIGAAFGPLLASVDLQLLLETFLEEYQLPTGFVWFVEKILMSLPGSGLALIVASMIGGWLGGMILGAWSGVVSGAAVGGILGIGRWRGKTLPVTDALRSSRLDFFFDHGLSSWLSRLALRDATGALLGAAFALGLWFYYTAHLKELGAEANIPLVFGPFDVSFMGAAIGLLTGGLCIRVDRLAPWALPGAAVGALVARGVQGSVPPEVLYPSMAVAGLGGHVASLFVGPLRGHWSWFREGGLIAAGLTLWLLQSPLLAVAIVLLLLGQSHRFVPPELEPSGAAARRTEEADATATSAPVWGFGAFLKFLWAYGTRFKTIASVGFGLFLGGFFGYAGGGYLVWWVGFAVLAHLGTLRAKWKRAGELSAEARALGAPTGPWFDFGLDYSLKAAWAVVPLAIVGLALGQQSLLSSSEDSPAPASAPQSVPAVPVQARTPTSPGPTPGAVPSVPADTKVPANAGRARPRSALSHPGPIALSASALEPVADPHVGDQVAAEWDSAWFRAEVLTREGDSVRVHFLGWESEWDRELSVDSLRRPTQATAPSAHAQDPAAAGGTGLGSADPMPNAMTVRWVSLAKGAAVDAELGSLPALGERYTTRLDLVEMPLNEALDGMRVETGRSLGAIVEGWFRTPEEGEYTLSVESDGRVSLWVDDEPLKPGDARDLDRGAHGFRLHYRHGGGVTLTLVLEMAGPDQPSRVLDMNLHGIAQVVEQPDGSTRLALPEAVLFGNDEHVLGARAKQALAAVKRLVFDPAPDAHVAIEGHTDDRGDAAYNEALSRRRAESVQSWLVAEGRRPETLIVEAYGESRPRAANDTESHRAANRRVEFVIHPAGSVHGEPVASHRTEAHSGGKEPPAQTRRPRGFREADARAHEEAPRAKVIRATPTPKTPPEPEAPPKSPASAATSVEPPTGRAGFIAAPPPGSKERRPVQAQRPGFVAAPPP